MGAGQALQIGLAHLNLFSHIGAFSAGGLCGSGIEEAYGGVFRDPAAFEKRVALLWAGMGTAEGPRFAGARDFITALKQHGIRAVWFEAPGTSHEWQTWRVCLREFAPRLFRK